MGVFIRAVQSRDVLPGIHHGAGLKGEDMTEGTRAALEPWAPKRFWDTSVLPTDILCSD